SPGLSEEREPVAEVERRVIFARDETAGGVKVGAESREGVAQRQPAAGTLEERGEHGTLLGDAGRAGAAARTLGRERVDLAEQDAGVECGDPVEIAAVD